MLFRRHRGSLHESLQTTAEIEPTREAVLGQVNKGLDIWDGKLTADMLRFESYGFDERIGWDTYIVTAPYGVGSVVVGFTSGPVA